MFLPDFSFPVIFRICIVDPENALNICPPTSISKALEPMMNSLPKMDNRNFGNIMIIRNIGTEIIKFNMLVCFTILRKPVLSFDANNSANFGVAMLLIARRATEFNAAIFTAVL